jgi:hypothetical protein
LFSSTDDRSVVDGQNANRGVDGERRSLVVVVGSEAETKEGVIIDVSVGDDDNSPDTRGDTRNKTGARKLVTTSVVSTAGNVLVQLASEVLRDGTRIDSQ